MIRLSSQGARPTGENNKQTNKTTVNEHSEFFWVLTGGRRRLKNKKIQRGAQDAYCTHTNGQMVVLIGSR